MTLSQNALENKGGARPPLFGLIDRALEIEPALHPFGFRAQPHEKPEDFYDQGAILACLGWLAKAKRTARVNRRTTAYRWKHNAEWSREGQYAGYVPEGVLIAVAIACGEKYERVGTDCYLAIAESARGR